MNWADYHPQLRTIFAGIFSVNRNISIPIFLILPALRAKNATFLSPREVQTSVSANLL
jgi:hypothetical protein